MIFASLIREWKELSRFRALEPRLRSIVFYAEDSSSWTYFEPIVRELTGALGKQICYVTSSKDDQILDLNEESIRTFCIGSGTVRTAFFLSLEADIMVMTMPDLGTFHIKRSKEPVHYVYVYHSLVSSHMSYRRGAFDQFDAILCVGPHHKEEIRATEELYGLEPKILIEAGYGRLDSILEFEASLPSHLTDSHSGTKRVLVAPSWGENSLLENYGPELVEVLLGTGHHITVRPHVMVIRHRRRLLGRLQQRFGPNPNFALDLSLGSQAVMHDYDLLVADWGGSAFEYAFGLERPVLFVDVPRKVFNPEYERITCTPMEVQARSEIGDIVSPDRLQEVPDRIESLLEDTGVRKGRIIEARSRWVYNLGSSGKVGAEYISRKADNLSNGTDPGQK
tara:strand:- start:7572 stop:8753 length:1182 start_codon:yes stop_codon:yes gene_type:complete